MALEEYQNKFIELMREIKSQENKNNLLKWIYHNWNIDELLKEDCLPKKILSSIAEELRSKVSIDALLPSEKIKLPVCGPNSDCKSETTIHVDEFLYDDDLVNELVDQGQLPRHYCAQCLSRNIKLLTFISHSISINRIHYLFRCLLPPLKKETILDVGSRLGPVLYGAYMYTTCPKIIGVEINSEFCKLQTEIVKKYKFGDRIQIICNNIFNEMEVLSSADVIVLNNVFEFFTDTETSITSWQILAQNIKPGCILVTIPHLEDTFQHIKVNFNWKDWVEELEPYQKDFLIDGEELENNLNYVKHYKVKNKI